MPNVANVSNSDELGLSAGKNSLLKMPANRPKTVKSNHSSALPIVEEITTRRRICAMASACICSSLRYRRFASPRSLPYVTDPIAKQWQTTTGSFRRVSGGGLFSHLLRCVVARELCEIRARRRAEGTAGCAGGDLALNSLHVIASQRGA